MSSAIDVVEEFWRLMATNDFDSVAAVLADDFVWDLPQSKERIRGAKNFAQVNREYPANAPWQFETHRVFGSDTEAVSDVTVTDGVQTARAISFFTIKHDKITCLREYWPEPYAAPPGRAHLVEVME
jgi:ketosteroid isomerase-like protein